MTNVEGTSAIFTAVGLVRHTQIFAGCDDADIAEVVRKSRFESYPAGSTIVREGEVAKEFFIVAEGRAAVWKEGSGEGAGRKKMIKQFDKDGDGRLNDAEWAEAQKTREMLEKKGGAGKFREQALKKFDKDGDGQLNDAERAEAEKFRAAQVKKFDADGDGKLNEAERQNSRKALMNDNPGGKRKKDQ